MTEALRELVEQFDATEQQVVAKEPDGVHRHRTVVRRLRSLLTVFRGFYDPVASDWLRSELSRWGSRLGTVRDHEVAAHHFEEGLADPAGMDPTGAARRRLVAAERRRAASARRRLIADLDSERHTAVRRALRRFVREPPLRASATGKSEKRLRRTLDREGRRVLRKADRLDGSLESHHELRKAARRLRYAVEALTAEPVGLFGKRVRRVGRRAHKIQAILGDHRDALHAADLARRWGVLAVDAGEDRAVHAAIAQTSELFAAERMAESEPAIRRLKAAIARARH